MNMDTTWNNYPTVEPCPHVHVVPKYQTKDGAPSQPKPIHLTLWFIRCEDCGETLWSANGIGPAVLKVRR